MSQRQPDDIVILTHTRERHHLSLQAYDRAPMTEELQELGLKVGHRRIERLMHETDIKIIKTQKYKAAIIVWQAITKQSAKRVQQPHIRHCAQPAGSGLLSEGWFYLTVILDLDSRRHPMDCQ